MGEFRGPGDGEHGQIRGPRAGTMFVLSPTVFVAAGTSAGVG